MVAVVPQDQKLTGRNGDGAEVVKGLLSTIGLVLLLIVYEQISILHDDHIPLRSDHPLYERLLRLFTRIAGGIEHHIPECLGRVEDDDFPSARGANPLGDFLDRELRRAARRASAKIGLGTR